MAAHPAHAPDSSPSGIYPDGTPLLAVPDALVDLIAERAAELLADRVANWQQEDGWLRGADRIAAYIDCPRSRVYALTSAGRLPVERDGSALIARRSELDAFVRSGGARRP
ncbi:MAG: hypothetical protein WB507_02360 [Solirubrobacterales bacterium]